MKSTPRGRMQIVLFLLTLLIGGQFAVFVLQAGRIGPITVPRPPGVEGFLPIGALMGWKRFLLTGQWDAVHPAAMVILGYAIGLSFLLRKTFCSWFCPIGALSEWLWRIGAKFNLTVSKPHPYVDRPLRFLKYLLLAFFIWAVSYMDADQIAAFIQSPYYKLVDVKMLYFFTRMTLFPAIVISLLSLLSIFIKNFWCRYLCPYGALLGIFSWFSPTRILRDPNLCTRCGRCDRSCSAFLTIATKPNVTGPDCTGCMDCVSACPTQGALKLVTLGMKTDSWSPRRVGAVIAVSFIVVVFLASITGHWRGSVSDAEFQMRLPFIDAPENSHPSLSAR